MNADKMIHKRERKAKRLRRSWILHAYHIESSRLISLPADFTVVDPGNNIKGLETWK